MILRWRLFLLLSVIFHSLKGQAVLPVRENGKGRFIPFTPTSFSNAFTLYRAPVLTIKSGDTVSTETIDAFGKDKQGVKRQKGGNPLTGPFFIENCVTGDVLQITLTKVSLNRPYAYTSESFVTRSMPDDIVSQFKKPHLVRWRLDIENGLGWPDSSFRPYEHLQNFKVPLKPFLGCIGVAPSGKKNEILSFYQGAFGGNMDFSGTGQSSTVYLPVFHDGGYLYIGDGHAVQGDGEVAGNALETSLDVEFTVNVIKKDQLQINSPRVEDSVYIMAIGYDKKLENALKMATAGLLDWLQKDYQISQEEATQVISTTIEYKIAEIADPEVIVVAKMKKTLLKTLIKTPEN